ncbi:hypothetical protein [Paenibacillus validus]|uniref:Uncharacterized protein n=1 Tax=Paenibacillus validus TaxID=44253 RepID=A0A7X2Z8P8_9BACL|nr:hypothetical protein [Paenibacillus validus]MUG70383.1 hypothetical protein [Paenibacillus validus]
MSEPAKEPDKVKFCNGCGHSMHDPSSIIIEYWSSHHTVYFCWCHACGWRGEVVEVKRMITTETEE